MNHSLTHEHDRSSLRSHKHVNSMTCIGTGDDFTISRALDCTSAHTHTDLVRTGFVRVHRLVRLPRDVFGRRVQIPHRQIDDAMKAPLRKGMRAVRFELKGGSPVGKLNSSTHRRAGGFRPPSDTRGGDDLAPNHFLGQVLSVKLSVLPGLLRRGCLCVPLSI